MKSGSGDYSYKQFHRELEHRNGGSAMLWGGALVLLFVSLLIATRSLDDMKATRTAQANVVAMFDKIGDSPSKAAERQELARSILVVKRFNNSIPEFNDPKAEKQLAAVARTGGPLDLQPLRIDRAGMLLSAAFMWLISVLSLASLKYGGRYVGMCTDRGYRLWYLPWNKWWAWQVPLRAPWLIPFLIGSFLRTLHDGHVARKSTVKK